MTNASASTWDEVRIRVAAALAGLPDGGYLVLGEPAPPALPRGGGLRGIFGRRGSPVQVRFVQARRDGDQLGVECVGASAFGGPFDVTPAQDVRLRALGWLAPGDASYEPMGGPAYRRWIGVAESAAAAALLVASLEVLGAGASDPLELTTGH